MTRKGIAESNPSKGPVSIVVSACDRESDILQLCLDSLLKHTRYIEHEILVVTPHESALTSFGSEQEGAHGLRQVACDARAHTEAAFNIGLRSATYELVALLDAAVIVEPDWLAPLVKIASKNPLAAVLGGRLSDTSGILRSAGLICTPADGFVPKFKGEKKASFQALQQAAVPAFDLGLALTRRNVIDRIGPLDESLSAFAGIDFCLRALDAGFTVNYVPQSLATDMRATSPGENPSGCAPRALAAYLDGMDGFYSKWANHQSESLDPTILRDMRTYRSKFRADCIRQLQDIGVLDPNRMLGPECASPAAGAWPQ